MQFSPIEGLILAAVYIIPLGISVFFFVAAVFFVRWALGLKRFLAIAEANLELNRRRAAHAEKSVSILVAIRDRLEQRAGHDQSM